MNQLNLTPDELAKGAGVSIFSAHSALAGNLGTLKKLRKVTDFLNIDWKYITHVDLEESDFDRAVTKGRAVRSRKG